MRTDDAQSRSGLFDLARWVALARAVVTWERLWPALWPAAALTGAFLGVALLDVLPRLPDWAHGLFLVAMASALAWLARRAWTHAALADEPAGRARIERDSGLDHRPLTALEDRLASGGDDPAAHALWQAHLAAAAARARALRLNPPTPGLAARDPIAWRAAALLLLAIGLIAGHDDAARRIYRALNPGIAATDALVLEAWITPPTYTRRAPIFLSRESHSARAEAPPVLVPVGSAVLVQASGSGARASALDLRLNVGDARVAFAPLWQDGGKDAPQGAPPGNGAGADHGKGRTTLRAEAIVEADEVASSALALIVTAGGGEIHRWPIRLVPDAAPEVAFLAPPSAAAQARLRVDFEARDDYGVTEVAAIIRRPADKDDGEELRVSLQTGTAGPEVRGTSLHDLSAHPWAGTDVVVHLEATDAMGQIGVSDAIPARLPERFFNHPVARALADIRKRLVDPTPEAMEDAVMELERLSARPQHFAHDTVVYLALRTVIGRLVHDGSPAGVATARAVLWETALRIEDGKFAVAGRDLRDAQERLARALREGRGDPAEAERLLDEIKRALDKLFAALAREMADGAAEPVPFDPETMQMIDAADLYRMIEEARELMRMGSMDAARQMLAELQRMLQGLQRGLAAQPRPGEGQKAARAMKDLRELAQRQQQLLDRTYRRARDGDRGQGKQGQDKGAPNAAADARAQNALRRLLGQMMTQMDEMLGQIPDSLGAAERAMREAEQALGQGDAQAAIPGQTKAAQKLREAVQGIGEQLARRMGGPGAIGEMPGETPGPNRDPFGREPSGAMGTSGGDVRVPSQGERMRAREILDELRRRSGERDRPQLERDYIDRLLKMF